MEQEKPVHTIVLDTGAIIKNDPPVSTLLHRCESLATVPAIISEIKDAATRTRVETTLKPFLTIRSPSPASLKFVTDFARRTGDLAVLSKPDLQIIALTYEIECERNQGDWRLRRVPGQKGVNGSPPSRAPGDTDHVSPSLPENAAEESLESTLDAQHTSLAEENDEEAPASQQLIEARNGEITQSRDEQQDQLDESLSNHLAETRLDPEPSSLSLDADPAVDMFQVVGMTAESSESDSEGWITPSNLKKKQAEDAESSTTQSPEPKTMQVAVLTTDFAMQNVILQINLNLLSRTLTRVKHLKTFVLRCHACFQITKDMSKQFCPRCGQPALTRVSCSTSANGEFKLHLKKNMQWNSRGDRYSVPKPVAGSANGRVKGGGKGGWGNDLIFAEDQKEYQGAVTKEKKVKTRDLMDEDYLPAILSGDRRREGGRIKVGAGRNVNSRKR